MAKAKKPKEPPLRVKIEDDLAAVVRSRCNPDEHGAAAALVNAALRRQFEELRWIRPLLAPAESLDLRPGG